MNIYYLKKFRKRFKVVSNGDKFRLYDFKRKRFDPLAETFSLCVIAGLFKLIGIHELVSYVKRSKQRNIAKEGFKKPTS